MRNKCTLETRLSGPTVMFSLSHAVRNERWWRDWWSCCVQNQCRVFTINVEVEVDRVSVGGLGQGYGRFEEDTGRGHWNRLAAERSSEVFELSTSKNNGLRLAGMPGSSMKNASPGPECPMNLPPPGMAVPCRAHQLHHLEVTRSGC